MTSTGRSELPTGAKPIYVGGPAAGLVAEPGSETVLVITALSEARAMPACIYTRRKFGAGAEVFVAYAPEDWSDAQVQRELIRSYVDSRSLSG